MAAVRLARIAWTTLDRPASVALVVAGVWGLGLIIAGFAVPMYRTTSESTSGRVAHGTDTLVGVNGTAVVVVLALPLAVTALVGCALLLRAHRGGLPVAWTLTGLLAGFNVLAIMSIGLFIIPVTLALVVACMTSRPSTGRRPVSGSSAVR